MIYLLHDPVNLAILCVDLVAHVQGHVPQVADNASHLLQVLVHLIFPGIVCYPEHRKVRCKYWAVCAEDQVTASTIWNNIGHLLKVMIGGAETDLRPEIGRGQR